MCMQTATLAVTEGEGFAVRSTDDRNGTPIRRASKDILLVGRYVHPKAGWTLNVTPERLEQLAATARAMIAEGVDIEITVDHRPDADAVIGYLADVWVDGDRLMALHEIRGQTAIDLSERVQRVSVEIEPDFADGKGRQWGDAITAVSLVQQPVVPGQNDFVTLSRRGLDLQAPIMLFSNSAKTKTAKTAKEHTTMNHLTTAALAILSLSAMPEGGEEALAAQLAEHFDGLDEKGKELDTRLASLQTEIDTLKASRKGDTEISEDRAELLADRAEVAGEKLAGLEGQQITLTKEIISKLAASLVPTTNEARALMFSRSGESKGVSRGVIDLLAAEAKPHALAGKSKTGAQAMAFSRDAAGAAEGEAKDFDQSVQDEMANYIS